LIHAIQGIIPIVISFFVGIFVRNRGILEKEDGTRLLKLIFYFTLPASIFLSVTNVSISIEFFFLPVIAIVTFLTITVISFFLFHPYKKSPEKFGVLIIASIIMNTLIFSSLAELDTELAANLVSFGIGFGMIITTGLILLVG